MGELTSVDFENLMSQADGDFRSAEEMGDAWNPTEDCDLLIGMTKPDTGAYKNKKTGKSELYWAVTAQVVEGGYQGNNIRLFFTNGNAPSLGRLKKLCSVLLGVPFDQGLSEANALLVQHGEAGTIVKVHYSKNGNYHNYTPLETLEEVAPG